MEETQKVQLSDKTYKIIEDAITHYPKGQQKSAIFDALFAAQEDNKGWLSVPVMDHVAELLGILPIEVYEVASFYSMYNLQPVGKYVLEVCQTGPCMICGSDEIIKTVKDKLGIGPGETTADGMFTLKPSECLGACGYAPMLRLGNNYREHLTPEKMEALIEELKNKG